jgi:predicted transcriptional regulator
LKGSYHDKEQLITAGLTAEQAEKVLTLCKTTIDGSFIPKDRFNEVNAEAKQAKDSLKECDGQLETLKNTAGVVDALKKQIDDLQTANTEKEKVHSAAL